MGTPLEMDTPHQRKPKEFEGKGKGDGRLGTGVLK